MALFSLLIAILVERMKLLPEELQLESLLRHYTKLFFGRSERNSDLMMVLAVLLPAVVVYVISWAVSGLFWGALTLLVWVAVAILCFSHIKQRKLFKRYIQAACRGDAQACYHFAGELDCHDCYQAVSEEELGQKVGQAVAWLNYRHYGAVALFLIFFGPVGAIFYCTVRHFADERIQSQQSGAPQSSDVEAQAVSGPSASMLNKLLTVLDWLPSRLFAFGFVLSGHFSAGFSAWIRHGLAIDASARDVVTKVAFASETSVEETSAPICVHSTLALLQLTKRNFLLLLTALSLMTIFGVVS